LPDKSNRDLLTRVSGFQQINRQQNTWARRVLFRALTQHGFAAPGNHEEITVP
jgi:hypothetical protein